MTLTRSQKGELKKIDAGCKRIEKLSGLTGFSLEDYIPEQDFHFSEITDFEKRHTIEQGRSRKEVFERSGQRNSKMA